MQLPDYKQDGSGTDPMGGRLVKCTRNNRVAIVASCFHQNIVVVDKVQLLVVLLLVVGGLLVLDLVASEFHPGVVVVVVVVLRGRCSTASVAALCFAGLVGFLHPNGSVGSRRYRSEWCIKVSFFVHQETAASSPETEDRFLLLYSCKRRSSSSSRIKVSIRVDTESTETMVGLFGSSSELFFDGRLSSCWLCLLLGRKEIALVVHTEIASPVHSCKHCRNRNWRYNHRPNGVDFGGGPCRNSGKDCDHGESGAVRSFHSLAGEKTKSIGTDRTKWYRELFVIVFVL